MIDIYNFNLSYICNNLTFITIRIFLIMYMIPVIGNFLIRFWLKIFFSLLISTLIMPFIPCTHTTLLSYNGIFLVLEQAVIGLCFGIIIQLIFFFITCAGETICIQIGLYNTNDFFCNVFSHISIITKILNIFLLLLFLSYNGHLWILHFIVHSFYIFPLCSKMFNIRIFTVIIKMLHFSFVNGLILILPILLLLFLINILIGTMFRLSPYISNLLTRLSLFYFLTIFFLFFSNTIFFYVLICLLKKMINLF